MRQQHKHKQESANALDRLAERTRIEAEFKNARSRIVPTASETKRRLLAAMGAEAGDEVAAEATLAELDRGEWLSPLPPVQVFRADAAPIGLDIALPADTREIFRWPQLEDGGERGGRSVFGELALVGERDLGSFIFCAPTITGAPGILVTCGRSLNSPRQTVPT